MSFWISWSWPSTSNLSPSVCVTNLLITAPWDDFSGNLLIHSPMFILTMSQSWPQSAICCTCKLTGLWSPTILVTDSLVIMCVHKSKNITIECNMLYFKWPWELIGLWNSTLKCGCGGSAIAHWEICSGSVDLPFILRLTCIWNLCYWKLCEKFINESIGRMRSAGHHQAYHHLLVSCWRAWTYHFTQMDFVLALAEYKEVWFLY